MADALRRLGHEVEPFAWHEYVSSTPSPGMLLRRAQNKYLVGPLLSRINRDLEARVVAHQADLVFVYRGTHVLRAALERIRQRVPHVRLIGYNNDDPYAAGQPSWPWRHFRAAIPAYDCVLAYRPHNLDDFRAAGARSTRLLMPWFVPQIHHPVDLSEADRARYGSEVVFIGHYEPDGRLEAIAALAAAGVRVRLFGPGSGHPGYDWHGPLAAHPQLAGLMPVREAWNGEYTRALCASRVALCFLSKRNRDRYTRRCFEIPATGTMLMSEYTPELAALYREGQDAEFFRSTGELVAKVRAYLANPAARDAVAASGLERVHREGHDVVSRVRRMLEEVVSEPRLETAV